MTELINPLRSRPSAEREPATPSTEEALSREQMARLNPRSVTCGPYKRDVEAFADLQNRVVVPADNS